MRSARTICSLSLSLALLFLKRKKGSQFLDYFRQVQQRQNFGTCHCNSLCGSETKIHNDFPTFLLISLVARFCGPVGSKSGSSICGETLNDDSGELSPCESRVGFFAAKADAAADLEKQVCEDLGLGSIDISTCDTDHELLRERSTMCIKNAADDADVEDNADVDFEDNTDVDVEDDAEIKTDAKSNLNAGEESFKNEDDSKINPSQTLPIADM